MPGDDNRFLAAYEKTHDLLLDIFNSDNQAFLDSE